DSTAAGLAHGADRSAGPAPLVGPHRTAAGDPQLRWGLCPHRRARAARGAPGPAGGLLRHRAADGDLRLLRRLAAADAPELPLRSRGSPPGGGPAWPGPGAGSPFAGARPVGELPAGDRAAPAPGLAGRFAARRDL